MIISERLGARKGILDWRGHRGSSSHSRADVSCRRWFDLGTYREGMLATFLDSTETRLIDPRYAGNTIIWLLRLSLLFQKVDKRYVIE